MPIHSLMETLTDPSPTDRDYFLICSARAIVRNLPAGSGSDSQASHRAICAACVWGLIPLRISARGYGQIQQKLLKLVQYYRALKA